MQVNKLPFRILSSTIAFIFLISTPVAPQTLAARISPVPNETSIKFPQDLSSLRVPKDLATIDGLYQGKKQKTVILIQDAHAIPDAQQSIEQLIEYFQQRYKMNTVALEGASATLDPQIFLSFPDQELLAKVFNEYRQNGELAGGPAAAIFSAQNGGSPNAHYFGVEDWGLYEQGIRLYQQTMTAESALSEKMNSLKKEIEIRKEKIYSKELFQLDQKLESFYENHSDLLKVLEALAKIKAPRVQSELAILLEENNQRYDEASIEREVKQIADHIKGVLVKKTASKENQSTLMEFNQKYQDFTTSKITVQAFAAYLKSVAIEQRIRVRVSRGLHGKTLKQQKLENIKGTKLFKDFEIYADEVKDSLIQSAEEKQVSDQNERFRLLKTFMKLELSHEDWGEVKQLIGDNKKYLRNGVYSGPVDLSNEEFEILKKMEAHHRFYQVANERDDRFLKNLKSLMSDRRTDQVMLVAGGFHTHNLARIFEENQISYVLLMPKIESIPEETNYRRQMQGDVSWKEYFEEENGQINLYKAFVRAVRDKLIKQSNAGDRVLKVWRDKIIQDLAEKNRIAESGRYTRFIDEVTGEKINEGSQAGRKLILKANEFADGLRELYDSGRLSQDNILQLLKNPTGPLTATTATAPSVNILIDQPLSADLIRSSSAPSPTLALSESRSGRNEPGAYRRDVNGQIPPNGTRPNGPLDGDSYIRSEVRVPVKIALSDGRQLNVDIVLEKVAADDGKRWISVDDENVLSVEELSGMLIGVGNVRLSIKSQEVAFDSKNIPTGDTLNQVLKDLARSEEVLGMDGLMQRAPAEARALNDGTELIIDSERANREKEILASLRTVIRNRNIGEYEDAQERAEIDPMLAADKLIAAMNKSTWEVETLLENMREYRLIYQLLLNRDIQLAQGIGFLALLGVDPQMFRELIRFRAGRHTTKGSLFSSFYRFFDFLRIAIRVLLALRTYESFFLYLPYLLAPANVPLKDVRRVKPEDMTGSLINEVTDDGRNLEGLARLDRGTMEETLQENLIYDLEIALLENKLPNAVEVVRKFVLSLDADDLVLNREVLLETLARLRESILTEDQLSGFIETIIQDELLIEKTEIDLYAYEFRDAITRSEMRVVTADQGAHDFWRRVESKNSALLNADGENEAVNQALVSGTGVLSEVLSGKLLNPRPRKSETAEWDAKISAAVADGTAKSLKAALSDAQRGAGLADLKKQSKNANLQSWDLVVAGESIGIVGWESAEGAIGQAPNAVTIDTINTPFNGLSEGWKGKNANAVKWSQTHEGLISGYGKAELAAAMQAAIDAGFAGTSMVESLGKQGAIGQALLNFASAIHEEWMANNKKEGWNDNLFVPFAELPVIEQLKDINGLVGTLRVRSEVRGQQAIDDFYAQGYDNQLWDSGRFRLESIQRVDYNNLRAAVEAVAALDESVTPKIIFDILNMINTERNFQKFAAVTGLEAIRGIALEKLKQKQSGELPENYFQGYGLVTAFRTWVILEQDLGAKSDLSRNTARSEMRASDAFQLGIEGLNTNDMALLYLSGEEYLEYARVSGGFQFLSPRINPLEAQWLSSVGIDNAVVPIAIATPHQFDVPFGMKKVVTYTHPITGKRERFEVTNPQMFYFLPTSVERRVQVAKDKLPPLVRQVLQWRRTMVEQFNAYNAQNPPRQGKYMIVQANASGGIFAVGQLGNADAVRALIAKGVVAFDGGSLKLVGESAESFSIRNPIEGAVSRSEMRNDAELTYVKPGYYNDGDGSLTITVNKGEPVTIRLRSQYFGAEDLETVKGLLEKAGNPEEITRVIEGIRGAVSKTSGGNTVDLSALPRSEMRNDEFGEGQTDWRRDRQIAEIRARGNDYVIDGQGFVRELDSKSREAVNDLEAAREARETLELKARLEEQERQRQREIAEIRARGNDYVIDGYGFVQELDSRSRLPINNLGGRSEVREGIDAEKNAISAIGVGERVAEGFAAFVAGQVGADDFSNSVYAAALEVKSFDDFQTGFLRAVEEEARKLEQTIELDRQEEFREIRDAAIAIIKDIVKAIPESYKNLGAMVVVNAEDAPLSEVDHHKKAVLDFGTEVIGRVFIAGVRGNEFSAWRAELAEAGLRDVEPTRTLDNIPIDSNDQGHVVQIFNRPAEAAIKTTRNPVISLGVAETAKTDASETAQWFQEQVQVFMLYAIALASLKALSAEDAKSYNDILLKDKRLRTADEIEALRKIQTKLNVEAKKTLLTYVSAVYLKYTNEELHSLFEGESLNLNPGMISNIISAYLAAQRAKVSA